MTTFLRLMAGYRVIMVKFIWHWSKWQTFRWPRQ